MWYVVYCNLFTMWYWVKQLHVRPWSRQPGMWKQRCRDCLDEKGLNPEISWGVGRCRDGEFEDMVWMWISYDKLGCQELIKPLNPNATEVQMVYGCVWYVVSSNFGNGCWTGTLFNAAALLAWSSHCIRDTAAVFIQVWSAALVNDQSLATHTSFSPWSARSFGFTYADWYTLILQPQASWESAGCVPPKLGSHVSWRPP